MFIPPLTRNLLLITWLELTSHFEPGQQRCWDVTVGHCSHPPPALPMPSHICTPLPSPSPSQSRQGTLESVLQLGSPPGSEATTEPLLLLHTRPKTSVCHQLTGQTNKRGTTMGNHLFCGTGATKRAGESSWLGMERKEDMGCACHILHNTRNPGSPF